MGMRVWCACVCVCGSLCMCTCVETEACGGCLVQFLSALSVEAGVPLEHTAR